MPCVHLSVDPELRISQSPEGWFCRCYRGCDFCNTLHYGCSEAYRWNGKYVFYCPKGLVFAAASLTDEQGALTGGLVLGPLVMGELDDTLAMLSGDSLCEQIAQLPRFDTGYVRHASEVLCAVAAGISGNVSSRYGSYVYEQEKLLNELYAIKNEMGVSRDSAYLIRSEKQLTALIAAQDKDGAGKLLNELLGYIFLSGNAELSAVKARLIEMLVLLSRSAIDAGAGIQEILLFNEGNIQYVEEISSLEELSAWVTVIMHRFMQYSFDFSSVKHADIVYKVIQFVKANFDKKISLEDVAAHVHLSRSYVSSLFKEEMGESLFAYINRVRIDKSKALLLSDKVSLADVGAMCGFEEQSYFTKVFKSVVGVSPKRFRDCRGKIDGQKSK